jgi:hypothetical protein
MAEMLCIENSFEVQAVLCVQHVLSSPQSRFTTLSNSQRDLESLEHGISIFNTDLACQ